MYDSDSLISRSNTTKKKKSTEAMPPTNTIL